ncbi:signal peptidase I [Mesoterricola sediminis]|uniref:Signal peptidase I n=1 Tax=Mesoterricola sediminis TaxID=2927980 RepID=A0AA48HBS2_9BACT|nr:signal peptidase I [Mesoterricola sediminis]BDU75393.1 signal peptidase I [Mesoterricola sediminis]
MRALLLAAGALALGLAPLAFVHPVRVAGRSMEPRLRDGDVRLVLRAWCAGRPAQGELWLAAAPGGTVVKRVVALPGSQVELRDGEVWIDGAYRPEPYVAQTDRETAGPWRTGDGYFLLGDNRGESRDSRAWGPLPAAALEGRILGSCW